MRRIFATLLPLLFFAIAQAQVLDPVKWSFEARHVSGDEFDLIYSAKIDKGWFIYSQYLESDDGPVKTSFEYEGKDHFDLVGKNKEIGKKKEGFDELFGMNVIKFGDKVNFSQRVKMKDYSKPIAGYLTFMTCDDKRCLPPKDVDFSFKIEKKAETKPAPKEETKPKPAPKPERAETKPAPKPAPAPKPTPAPKADNNKVATTTTKPAPKKEPAKAPEKTVAKKEDKPATKPAEPEPAPPSNTSGELKPVKWSFSQEKTGDKEYTLKYTAKVDKGWFIYSQYLESDDGPVRTSFEYEEDSKKNIEFVGKNEESGKKKEGFDKMFEMNVVKYAGDVTFTQKIKVKDDSKPVKGYLTYMTCDDSKCLPPTNVDFNFNLSTGQSSAGDTGGSAVADAGRVMVGNEIDQVRPVVKETYVTPVGDCGAEDNAAGQNMFWTFIFGFLGGLLALLTPCVFPMIPLTVSFFTKGSKDRASGIKNGLIYGLSIIVIYVAIGLLVTAIFGPEALNQLSTNWIANLLFFAIFVIFAFSFFGFFEITLPSSWTTKTDSMADKGGLIGTFFMAFTLALVSFSCTGPIIGSALVASATNTLGPLVVMLGFSTALALPFGLFAAFPAWLNSLPSSGGWMNSVKVVLGFLELALALKFLSVADMTMHWGILPYEIFMGLWILIFAGLTLYLLGFIRFPHDSPLKKLSPTRWGFALASLALTIYLCTGFGINSKTMNYSSLGLMSGLAPPANYNIFLPEYEETKPNPNIKSKYPSFTKCANNLDCFKDYYEGLAYAKEVNKPILLDFTGYGCVNCRKTEEHIWVEDQVWNKIDKEFVLVSLYVDDRKKLEEMLVSKSRQEKLRNIGNLWADFQIVNFEQNSQPLYVMMMPDERVLAKPRGYQEGVNDYAEFLDCGLGTFYDYCDGCDKTKKVGMTN